MNILYVPTLEHNLIPPFILRQATGIILNNIPKTHCQDPSKEDHCTRAPTVEDLRDRVVTLNLYDPSYSLMEETMIDIDGDILVPK